MPLPYKPNTRLNPANSSSMHKMLIQWPPKPATKEGESLVQMPRPNVYIGRQKKVGKKAERDCSTQRRKIKEKRKSKRRKKRKKEKKIKDEK
ncbi:hypothetical protein BT67DRAFT_128230 [Trichocladium antarcticum]|uniref:Uncharacterized protein n=1 Tax=Trichocladium antarcticum TaxID=1450529 RepID=A0AAN6US89_9PEZI|nr:hypothetical protein BT67DRAFT_128230 [Trichocladium antarcticum]